MQVDGRTYVCKLKGKEGPYTCVAKYSKLMVKYPLSYGQPKYQYFLLWAELSDDVDARGFHCNSMVLALLQSKLWWLLG